jgi:hypothetical protein
MSKSQTAKKPAAKKSAPTKKGASGSNKTKVAPPASVKPKQFRKGKKDKADKPQGSLPLGDKAPETTGEPEVGEEGTTTMTPPESDAAKPAAVASHADSVEGGTAEAAPVLRGKVESIDGYEVAPANFGPQIRRAGTTIGLVNLPMHVAPAERFESAMQLARELAAGPEALDLLKQVAEAVAEAAEHSGRVPDKTQDFLERIWNLLVQTKRVDSANVPEWMKTKS